MKTRTLLLTGIGSFLAFLIASAPVAAVYPRLAPEGSPLQLAGLSGSLFSGSAGSVSYLGRSVAQPLNWSFNPLALVAARLGVHVDGSTHGLLFDGDVARSLGGDLIVSDLAASGSLKGLMALGGAMQLPIDGEIGVKLDKLLIEARFPKQASAEITLARLRWSLGQPLILGDFAITVTTEAGVLIASVAPTAGPLEVNGDIRVNADRSYDVDLKVKARPEAEAPVRNLVATLGQPDTQGYFRIKTRAQL